jgi:hypothetical protein
MALDHYLNTLGIMSAINILTVSQGHHHEGMVIDEGIVIGKGEKLKE